MAREAASRAFMIQAKELFDAGKFSAAIMTLQEGLKQYPHFISARVLLGEIYWTSGEVALAKTELEQVVKAVPDNFAAHRKLAMVYRQAGEVAAAIKSCRTVLQANPRDLEMRGLLDQLQAGQLQVHIPGSSETPAAGRPAKPAASETGLVLAMEAELASSPEALAAIGDDVPPASSSEAAESIDSETLAELYIVQGYRDKGLAVYRRLATKDPGNSRIRDRIATLEGRSPAEEGASAEALAPVPAVLEEDPIRRRRQNQLRRLKGWLQIIRDRRRFS